MLLHVDGLDEGWDESVGQFDCTDVPIVFSRMNADVRLNPASVQLDYSTMAPRRENVKSQSTMSESAAGHSSLQRALIDNFSFRLRKRHGDPNEIRWPRRNGTARRYFTHNTHIKF